MLFSSTVFIYLFLPAVIAGYYLIFRGSRLLQNVFLLCASLFFYAWGEPKFVFVMVASIIVNWLFGLLVGRNHGNRKRSKALAALDVLFNLGLLFVFKYLMFTGNLIRSISGVDLHIPEIVLPIGISFFTFQSISYVIDVYRRKAEAQTNLLNVGLYISFFPQLIAGPIVRYETVAEEILNRRETAEDFFNGFARFVLGLSKKVLLANSIAIVADQTFGLIHRNGSVSVMFGWLGTLAYTLQIFFDFSGYSDMAIGMGRMFGFHFQENFNYPYMAVSVTEFWRRWHISLGTWFRDYVYIPLGGSRCSKMRNVLNLFVVWVLTGLWHGANLTFLVWGLMYFVLLLAENAIGFYRKEAVNKHLLQWRRVLGRFYTLFFVMIGMGIFRSDSLHDAVNYLKSVFKLNGNTFSDGLFAGWAAQSAIPLMIGVVLCTPVCSRINERIGKRGAAQMMKVLMMIGLFVLSIASLVSDTYNPFIYFRF